MNAKINGIEYSLENGEATIIRQNGRLSRDIVIPETVTYDGVDYMVTNVADYAFQRTRITSIKLPDSIKAFGDECFFECEQLKKITCGWDNLDELTTGYDVFSYIDPDCALYVPEGTKSIYKETEPWNEFVNIYEPGEGTEDEDDEDEDVQISAGDEEAYVTFTLYGRIEVYRVDAVAEGSEIDEDDFDENEDYSHYADEGLTIDNPLEFSLIFKRASGSIEWQGEEVMELDEDEIYDEHLCPVNWFGPRYSALRRQNVMSLMVPMSRMQQQFSIKLEPGETFDIDKLMLIDVSDDDLISQFKPEGFILCDYHISDAKANASENEAFAGGQMNFEQSWLLDGASDDLDMDLEYEDGYADSSEHSPEDSNAGTFMGEEYDSDAEELDLSEIGDRVKHLDLSKFTKLKKLNVSGLNIRELDLSHNPELESLDCSNCNYLTELDLTLTPKLKDLDVSHADKMVKIDISGLQQLDNVSMEGDALKEVVMKDTACTTLLLNGENLRNVDFTELKSVNSLVDWRENDDTVLDISMLHDLKELEVSRNNIETLVLPEGGKLEKINLSGCNELQHLNVSRLARLKYLSVKENILPLINFSEIPSLEDLKICANSDSFSSDGNELVLTGPDKVKKISVEDCKFKSIDFTGCKALEELSLSGGYSVERIDVSGLTNLKQIYGSWGVTLKTIMLKDNSALENLNCDASDLETPDFNEAVNIESLYLENYQGQSIDLHMLKNLTKLSLPSSTKLTALDVSSLAFLSALDCSNCTKLKDIEMSGCTKMKDLCLNGTAITSLDLSNMSELTSLSCDDCGSLTEVDITHNPEVRSLYMNSASIKKLIMKKGHKIYGINEDEERDDENINDVTEIVYK